MDEVKTEVRCRECADVQCDFVIECTAFQQEVLFKDDKGHDEHLSLWKCPRCNRHYLLAFSLDSRASSLKPIQGTFVLTYELTPDIAQVFESLVRRCPSPMDPGYCECEFHSGWKPWYLYIGHLNLVRRQFIGSDRQLASADVFGTEGAMEAHLHKRTDARRWPKGGNQ